jgi:integrase
MREGYKESTIYATCQRLKHLLKLGANIQDQKSVKDVIARQKWEEGTKLTYVNAFDRLCKMQGVEFKKQRYRYHHQKLPFIPTETEFDQLIASCSKKISTFLRVLKETKMRSGEAMNLEWKDFDFVTKTVRVNKPEKHGNTRLLKISNKLIAMLKGLPQKSKKVFCGSVHGIRTNFTIQRRRATQKLKNPNLKGLIFTRSDTGKQI